MLLDAANNTVQIFILYGLSDRQLVLCAVLLILNLRVFLE